jgi:CubicO group peptidase (beta-lactamase class C family)
VAGAPPIHGFCDERFAPVRAALEENFRERGELGAAVAITLDGEPVVDVWAGWMDEERTCAWGPDTLVAVFSVGKAMVALCALMLAERGQLRLDAPVAAVWPEFAAAGKDEVTPRMLLGHRAGLPALREELADDAVYDWQLMTEALARERPWWQPDTLHGYHVNTFGFLAGELVRRTTGESLGAFFRREVAAPLGADFHFGLPAEHDARTAEYYFSDTDVGEGGGDGARDRPDEERLFLLHRAYLNPPAVSGLGTVNTRAWRAAEIPSANAHATARAVAGIYAALVEHRLLGRAMLDEATGETSAGEDFVLGRPSRFGLGFQLTQPERPLGPSPRAFGHFGAGGSLGFADPDARLAFAYAMNRSGPRWQNPRNRALIDAVYASLQRA